VAPAEEKVIPLLRREGNLADRLVAAGAGRAFRQVSACGAKIPADSRAASDTMSQSIHSCCGPRSRGGAEVESRWPSRPACTLSQFSLAWGVLREPNVASAIVGASRPEQL